MIPRTHSEAEARERFLGHIAEMTRFHFALDHPQREKAFRLVGDVLAVLDGHAQELPGVDLVLRPMKGWQSGQIINEGASLSEAWGKLVKQLTPPESVGE